MKQFRFLMIATMIASIAFFSSCSDDDDDVDYSDTILGEWVSGATSIQATLYGVTIPNTQTSSDATSGTVWEFTSGGKFYISGTESGTYSLEGSKLTLSYLDSSNGTVDYTISISGDAMSLSSKVVDSSILSLLGISLSDSWFSYLTTGAEISTSVNFTRQ